MDLDLSDLQPYEAVASGSGTHGGPSTPGPAGPSTAPADPTGAKKQKSCAPCRIRRVK